MDHDQRWSICLNISVLEGLISKFDAPATGKNHTQACLIGIDEETES